MTRRIFTKWEDERLVRRASGVLFPSHSLLNVDAHEMFVQDFVVTTVGWTEIASAKPTLDDIRARISLYSVEYALASISRMVLALERRPVSGAGASFQEQQDFVLHGLLGPEIAAALRERVRRVRGDSIHQRERDVYVHERQLLTAAKMALVWIDVDSAVSYEDPTPLLEALLMINDILDRRFEDVDASKPSGRRVMASYEFALSLFMRSEGTAADDVRAFHQIISPPQLSQGADDFGVPDALSRATGLSAIDVVAAIRAIRADWATKSDEDVAAGRVFQDRSRYLLPLVHLDPATRHLWYSLAVAELPKLQERVRLRYAEDWQHFNFLEFELSPIVAIGDRLWCLSLRYLAQLGTDSLYHRILSSEHLTEREREHFQTTNGKIVESFAVQSITRMFGKRTITEELLKTHSRSRAGQKYCDAVVDYGDSIVLFEIKGTRVSLLARSATSVDAFLDAWKRPLLRSISQFIGTADLIRSDGLKALGIEATRIRKIYPVVVLADHEAPPATYSRIEKDILISTDFPSRVKRGQLERLTILNVRDLERLEHASEDGSSFLEVVREAHATSPDFVPPIATVLANGRLAVRNGLSSWMRSEFDRISTLYRTRLLELGLQSGDSVTDI